MERRDTTTDWGYWITPLGAYYPVGSHGHEAYIRKEEGMTSGQAMIRGWVRVVTANMFQVEACFDLLSSRAKATMVRLARQGDYHQFVADVYRDDGQYSVNRYAILHDFLRGIEALSHASETV
jgi:hypothetical protein